jgi:hypothetical protein
MSQRESFCVNERPGKGIYRCVEYPSWVVSIEDEFESLPPCFGEMRLGRVRYERVVDLSTAISEQEIAAR